MKNENLNPYLFPDSIDPLEKYNYDISITITSDCALYHSFSNPNLIDQHLLSIQNPQKKVLAKKQFQSQECTDHRIMFPGFLSEAFDLFLNVLTFIDSASYLHELLNLSGISGVQTLYIYVF